MVDRIVPFAMKIVRCNVESRHLLSGGSCTCAVRIIQTDLSGDGCVMRINRSWALSSRFQGWIQPPSLVCGRIGPVLSDDAPPRQPLTRRAAVAMAVCGTA